MGAKCFLLLWPGRKVAELICNSFVCNSAIRHPLFSTSLQNQTQMVPSTCLPIMSLCLYPLDFLPMTVKVYCPCRDTILCKHYTHNHTSLEKYFAIFQCCRKRNVNQAFPWTFDVRISIACILLKTQIFLSVDTKNKNL